MVLFLLLTFICQSLIDFNYQPDGERKMREGDQDGQETMMREAVEGEDTSRRSIQTMIEDPSMVTIIQDHHQGS